MLITPSNFDTALMILQGSELLACDTETTGLDVRNKRDYLQGFCWANNDFKCYMPFRHEAMNLSVNALKEMWSALKTKDMIWHNRKFDMHSIRTTGLDPLELTGVQYDTMLEFHLWNEELYSFQLDALGQKFVNQGKSIDMKNLAMLHGGWGKVPADVMAPYGAQDTEVTLKLHKFVWPKLITEGLDKVYLETEMPFTEILYSMEQRGVGVNKEFVEHKAMTGRGRMTTLYRKLGFNPASPKDLKRVLLDELNLPIFQHTGSCLECKKGQPVDSHEGVASFNKVAMKEYDDILSVMDNPTAQLISEYRGWQKATTALYEPLLERVGPDGYIRTDFRQNGTVTGRLSASEPNLQQVPRDSPKSWNGDAKSSFTSGREGYTLIGWDYSQLELRLAAAYGNEKLLLDEFSKPDADVFKVLTYEIFEEFTKELRQDTKTFVYANLYGAGLPKISRQLGRSLDETKGLYDNYKKSISGIMAVSNQVANLVKQRGYVKLWDGRRRHIKRKSDSYKAWNSVCQGGGAQLVKKAMIRCKDFEDEYCQMVLQVHDEITFIIKTDMISHYEPLIIEAMTNWDDIPGFSNVKFAVDGKEWK